MNLCARVYVLMFLYSIFYAAPIFGQGSRIHSDHGPVSIEDSAQARKRELWFQHGRVVPRESAAALRYRAHRQKLQLRALRSAQAHAAGVNLLPHDGATTTWKPLGPLPLASDASGFGVQDYGWVAGRATAVAIDPADGSGNTVYIGGAFGGVWKSVNAGHAQPKSFKCYLDSFDRRPANAGCGIDRDPASTHQPRFRQQRDPGGDGRNQQLRRLLLRPGYSAFPRCRQKLDTDLAGRLEHAFLCRPGLQQDRIQHFES